LILTYVLLKTSLGFLMDSVLKCEKNVPWFDVYVTTVISTIELISFLGKKWDTPR
jgi:hypothetical protein